MIDGISQLTLLEKIKKIRHQLPKQIVKEDSLVVFFQALDELRAVFVDLLNLHQHNCNDIQRQLDVSRKEIADRFISVTPILSKGMFQWIDSIKSTSTPDICFWEEVYLTFINMIAGIDTAKEDNPFLEEEKVLLNLLVKKLITPNLDPFFLKHFLPNYHFSCVDRKPTVYISNQENIDISKNLNKLIESINPLLSAQPEQIVTEFEKRVVEVNSLLLLSERITAKINDGSLKHTDSSSDKTLHSAIKLLKLIIKVQTQLKTLNDELTEFKKKISPKKKNKKLNGKKSKNQKKKNFKNFKQNKNNHPNLTDISSDDKLDPDINTSDEDTNKNIETLEQSLDERAVNEFSPCLILNTENPQAGFSIPEHKTTEPTLATEVQTAATNPTIQSLPKNKELVQLYKNKTLPRNPSSLPKSHTSECSNRTKKVLQSIFDLDNVKYTHLETFIENLFGEKIKKNKGSKRKITANSHDGKHFKLPLHEKHGHDRKDFVDPQVVKSLRKMLIALDITPDNYLDNKNKTNVKSKNKPKNR